MKDTLINTSVKRDFIEAVGRRREATARVRLYLINGKKEVTLSHHLLKIGSFIVNDKPATEYFPGQTNEKRYMEPLVATDMIKKVAVSVRVRGGGPVGQLEAVIHGLSRVLDDLNTEGFHTILKKRGFLTRDPRIKERRKAGRAGKARARKQSPKR